MVAAQVVDALDMGNAGRLVLSLVGVCVANGAFVAVYAPPRVGVMHRVILSVL